MGGGGGGHPRQAITQAADEQELIRSTFASLILILEFVQTVGCYQLPPCSLRPNSKSNISLASLPGSSSRGGLQARRVNNSSSPSSDSDGPRGVSRGLALAEEGAWGGINETW